MPATPGGNKISPYLLGIDGCPHGWVVVGRSAGKTEINAQLFTHFASILDTVISAHSRSALAIIVDMPIGLAEAGRRPCEAMARAKLGPRRSSVFAVPRRPMLGFSKYQDANQWGKAQGQGGGLSKQAWNILAKIREIDEAITPADQSFLGEGHPELAFTRLGGGPCLYNKKTKQGQAERAQLLRANGITNLSEVYQNLRTSYGARALALDDLHDACALALTAQARLAGKAWRLSDETKDARGLVMEIWG